MWIGRKRAQDHLSDYWNALVRNAPPNELALASEHVDPANRTAIEQVQALHLRHRPDPVFASNLETDLMNAIATSPAGTIPLPRPYPGAPNGRSAPARSPWLPDIGLGRRRARWALASLAAALLIVLAGIGGYFLYERRTDQPAVVTQPDTPEATPADQKSQFRYGPSHPGVSPSAGPIGQPIELWKFQTHGPIMSEPAIVHGVVYVGSGDGNLYAYDAISGTEQWRFEIGPAEGSSPAFDSGIVYITNSAGTLFAVDASTGLELWQFQGGRDNASLAIADGVAYIGGVNGTLHALDPETGEQVWSAPLGAEANRSAAIADGMAFVGTVDGVMHAFDIATGEELWQFQHEGYTPGTPVKVGDTLYFARGNGVTAVDALTGIERWGFETETVSPTTIPVVNDDRVYVSSHDGNIYALDAATGAEQWRFTTGGECNASMTLANGVIYAASKDQTLYGIDAETGTEVFSFPLDGLVDFGPAVLDGVAYVGTIRGILYAIGGSQEPVVQAHASTGSPIASPSAAEVISAELAWSTENLEGLDQPAVVSFAPDGSIWVLDFADLEVFVFSSSGELIERLGGRKPPAISSRRQPGERWHSHPSAPSTRSTPRI